VALAAAAGYFDLRKGVVKLQKVDVVEVEKLSEELNSKFSSLSVQSAKVAESVTTIQETFDNLKATFDKRVLPLNEILIGFDKTISTLKSSLENAQKTIDELKNSKSDKSELTAAVDKIAKQVTPLNQRLKDMAYEMNTLDENLTQELAELSSTLQKIKGELASYETLKKDLAALSSSKPDNARLTAQIENQTKSIEAVKRGLDERNRKIEDMEAQIQDLLKFKALSEIKKRLEPAGRLPSSAPNASSKVSRDRPQTTANTPVPEAKKQPPSEQGAIIEQTLQ
jgi:chromosome segregation ATPase